VAIEPADELHRRTYLACDCIINILAIGSAQADTEPIRGPPGWAPSIRASHAHDAQAPARRRLVELPSGRIPNERGSTPVKMDVSSRSDIPPSARRPSWALLYSAGVPFLCQALRLLGVLPNDVDDVLQDILLAAYRALHRYDASRYAREPPIVLQNVSAAPLGDPVPLARLRFRNRRAWNPLLAWLFGIAWRQVSHHRERAYRRREIPMGLHGNAIFAGVDDKPDPEQRVAAEERAQLVGKLLSRIAPQRRVVLVMHDMLDIPVVDVARELGINENTAQNRLRLARADVRAAVNRLTPEKRSALRLGERPFAVEASPSRRPVKPRR
jgi:RNA polymerase sigma-70 factor, ECF subfamily